MIQSVMIYIFEVNINMAMDKSFSNQSKYETRILRQKLGEKLINPDNLTVFKHTCICMEDDALMVLNGGLQVNANCLEDYGKPSVITIGKNSVFTVTPGSAKICYGADIAVFKDAGLTVGSSFINTEVLIRCAKSITIGNDCVISHRVVINDSDMHSLIEDGRVLPRYGTKGIVIEDHVWIGVNVTILKDVTIGEGSMIAAGAVVTKDIPAHCLAAGVPAKVIKTGIDWEK